MMRKQILAAVLALITCLGLTGVVGAEEQTIIYASTTEELLKAVSNYDAKPNVKVILEGKE